MFGLAHLGTQLDDYSKHLAAYLGSSGYETALCGIQHEASDAAMIGYDRILGNPKYDMSVFDFNSVDWDLENARAAADYIRQEHKKPFFLSVGLFNTHLNFPKADPELNPDYVDVPSQFYDNAENRRLWAAYLTSTRTADDCGRLRGHRTGCTQGVGGLGRYAVYLYDGSRASFSWYEV